MTLKPEPDPEIVACEMSTAPPPVLVKLRLCTAVLPIATSPKATVVALEESTPMPGVAVCAPGEEALV
jgi:hypothetical protein